MESPPGEEERREGWGPRTCGIRSRRDRYESTPGSILMDGWGFVLAPSYFYLPPRQGAVETASWVCACKFGTETESAWAQVMCRHSAFPHRPSGPSKATWSTPLESATLRHPQAHGIPNHLWKRPVEGERTGASSTKGLQSPLESSTCDGLRSVTHAEGAGILASETCQTRGKSLST